MKRSFIVLGGCGAMGRVAVRDLFAFARGARITIADFNEAGAKAYAKTFRSARVRGIWADASDASGLAHRLRGHDVVLNCTQHDFNLRVMKAALLARCHYLDLGGLFTWTRKQLRLDAAFRRAGLTAIPGVGGSPGITNVLARLAADRMSRVDSIRVRSAWFDPAAKAGDFSFAFSPQTVMEELTLHAYEYARGAFRKIPARTKWERHTYPRPFGSVWSLATRHSEVATLPESFDLKYCDFKLGYDRAFVREFERRWNAGWRLKDFKPLVAPRGKSNDLEILRVIVSGTVAATAGRGIRDRRSRLQRKEIVVDCIARASPAWKASAGDIDTGCPPSIVAQMMTQGEIVERGVVLPERAIPVQPFLGELRRRKMTIKVTTRRARA